MTQPSTLDWGEHVFYGDLLRTGDLTDSQPSFFALSLP